MSQDIGDTCHRSWATVPIRSIPRLPCRKPTSNARPVITALFIDHQAPAEVAARYGAHRAWVYKLQARYEAEGEAAADPRPGAPAELSRRHVVQKDLPPRAIARDGVRGPSEEVAQSPNIEQKQPASPRGGPA